MAYEWTKPPRDLPNRLRAARAYAGINQKDMADRLGLVRDTIRNYEKGKYPRPESAIFSAVIEPYIRETKMMRWWFEKTDIKVSHLFEEAAKDEDPDQEGQLGDRDLDQRGDTEEPGEGRAEGA